jgi:hypothetical protein
MPGRLEFLLPRLLLLNLPFLHPKMAWFMLLLLDGCGSSPFMAKPLVILHL